MIYGLQPIYTQESRVLILGSMPSVMSLQKAQYYGNPQNAMWKILFSLLEEPFVEEYHARLEVILRDVYKRQTWYWALFGNRHSE